MKSKRRSKSLSFSASNWVEEMITNRATELGMNWSQYIRHVIEKDAQKGRGDIEIKPEVSAIAQRATSTSFLSFSADDEFRQMLDSRAAQLGMSRSWYIRYLIQEDAARRGGSVIIKAKSNAPDKPARVKARPKKSG